MELPKNSRRADSSITALRTRTSVPATRTRDVAFQAHAKFTEIRRRPFLRLQPVQHPTPFGIFLLLTPGLQIVRRPVGIAKPCFRKRDVCINLKSPAGRDIVRRIAASSDVFVQNFRPGVIEEMGLGYEDLKAVKPDIVYVSISGFGRQGPYAKKRVYDPVIQALSGITDIQADHDAQRPRMMRTIIPDKTTALTAAQAITAALLGRERNGSGQHVELNMLDATVAFMWPEGMMRLTVVGDEPDGEIGQIAQDLVYKTTDGYITVAAMSNEQWAGTCRGLGKPEWIDDERFNTTAKRFDNIKERVALTGAVIETSDPF